MKQRGEPMPILLFLLIALVIAFCRCGAPPVIPSGPMLPGGRYIADSYVKATEGSCSFVPRESHSYVDVDDGGQIVAPLPLTIKCSTSYTDGFELNCYFLKNKLQLRGELYDVDKLIAAGEATGNVSGCTRVVVGVFMELKK